MTFTTKLNDDWGKKKVISEAEKSGKIIPYTSPRCRIFEGTSGSTGISLALVARALGYEAGMFPLLLPPPPPKDSITLCLTYISTIFQFSNSSIEIVLPDDTATEKLELIEKMGGTIVKGIYVFFNKRTISLSL